MVGNFNLGSHFVMGAYCLVWLHTVNQHSIAPRWSSLLLRCIIHISTFVKFVGGHECYGSLPVVFEDFVAVSGFCQLVNGYQVIKDVLCLIPVLIQLLIILVNIHDSILLI